MIDKLFLTEVIPFQSNFSTCEIYKFEMKKLEQELAESMNLKNIYNALDLADFKYVKTAKIELQILELACIKLNFGKEILLTKENGIKTLSLNGTKYQVILFPTFTVPEVDLKLEKTIYFMYSPQFEKISYCGILDLKNLNDTTISNFYKNHCYGDTKKFIDFKILQK